MKFCAFERLHLTIFSFSVILQTMFTKNGHVQGPELLGTTTATRIARAAPRNSLEL